MSSIAQRPPRGYLDSLAKLHEPAHDRAARRHFEALSRREQLEAVRRMAADGYGDYQIAHATRLSVEQVREWLGEGRA